MGVTDHAHSRMGLTEPSHSRMGVADHCHFLMKHLTTTWSFSKRENVKLAEDEVVHKADTESVREILSIEN